MPKSFNANIVLILDDHHPNHRQIFLLCEIEAVSDPHLPGSSLQTTWKRGEFLGIWGKSKKKVIKAKISHQRMGILRPPLPQTHRGNQPAAKGSVWKNLDFLTGWSGSADSGSLIWSSRIESVWTPFGILAHSSLAVLFIGGGGSDTFRGVGSIVILLSPHISAK